MVFGYFFIGSVFLFGGIKNLLHNYLCVWDEENQRFSYKNKGSINLDDLSSDIMISVCCLIIWPVTYLPFCICATLFFGVRATMLKVKHMFFPVYT